VGRKYKETCILQNVISFSSTKLCFYFRGEKDFPNLYMHSISLEYPKAITLKLLLMYLTTHISNQNYTFLFVSNAINREEIGSHSKNMENLYTKHY
jgi:hypothetical protein